MLAPWGGKKETSRRLHIAYAAYAVYNVFLFNWFLIIDSWQPFVGDLNSIQTEGMNQMEKIAGKM